MLKFTINCSTSNTLVNFNEYSPALKLISYFDETAKLHYLTAGLKIKTMQRE